MRPSARSWVGILLAFAAIGCSQPTLLISCLPSDTVCGDRCVDTMSDPAHCGTCEHACTAGTPCAGGTCLGGASGACAVNNCSANADCVNVNGTDTCVCHPGFTGPTCTPCSACAVGQFASGQCSPASDTVCTACSGQCLATEYMATPCMPTSDRVCKPCSTCATNHYPAGGCTPISDTVCATCDPACATCTSLNECTSCVSGAQPEGGKCPPAGAMCGNGFVDPNEGCDDGNLTSGDGCSSSCQVEPNHYCFGAGTSICRYGNCVFDALTQLPPISASFVVDGTGSAGAGGLTFSGRGTVYTVGDVSYPVMIEADVKYSGPDVTLLGGRGTGLRDPDRSNLPDNSVWAMLTASPSYPVEIDTGPGQIPIATGSAASFAPGPGATYRIRYVDDGYLTHVDWYNLANPGLGMSLPAATSFHGGGDRAFVGGGDMSGLTLTNLRACWAPQLPSISGLVARYTALETWTITYDAANKVGLWQDISGNGNDLNANGTTALFAPGIFNGKPALDFSNGGGLVTAAFPLGTESTIFVVMQHRTPDAFGAIAHHGDRDFDWSLEQSSLAPNGTGSYPGSINSYHFQTRNDNVNEDLTLVPNTNYILTGAISGSNLTRFFSATAFDGTTQTASFNDTALSIVPAPKQLYVGRSNNNEASNAYIAELLYYNRALVATERALVIDYLRNIWGP